MVASLVSECYHRLVALAMANSCRYFDNEKLSDITIDVFERQIKAHRLVLAGQSPYFEALFDSKFQVSTLTYIVTHSLTLKKDSSPPEIELLGDDPDDVHAMIVYMYIENIDWSAEDIRSGKEPVPVGLMLIADKYQFENLVGKVVA